jgi:hypothetical protein
MSNEPNFCGSCGAGLKDSPSFCPACGTTVNKTNRVSATITVSSDGFLKRFWKKSIKARIFYGLWVLLNFTNILTFFSSASAPVDRFRSVCGWEGVSCAPSSQDRMSQAVLNLIIWNLLFWGFRFFYKKRQSKNSST